MKVKEKSTVPNEMNTNEVFSEAIMLHQIFRRPECGTDIPDLRGFLYEIKVDDIRKRFDLLSVADNKLANAEKVPSNLKSACINNKKKNTKKKNFRLLYENSKKDARNARTT